jgi:hypothetical protein
VATRLRSPNQLRATGDSESSLKVAIIAAPWHETSMGDQRRVLSAGGPPIALYRERREHREDEHDPGERLP